MHPHLRALADRQGGVFTRGQALAAGYSPAEISRLIAGGQWQRRRRGVFATAAAVELAQQEHRTAHLLDAAGVLAGMRTVAYLSHRSAALAWRLPLVGAPPDAVALTMVRQHRREAADVELHTATVPAHARAAVGPLPVTSVARTVSDLARSLPFGPAIAAADAALHRGMCTAGDLERIVGDCWVWPGIARTKRVLAFADGRSESPGESLSRVAFAAAGLPAPALQTELVVEGRTFRPDFLWPEQRLVGEFDGRTKYATREDLWQEKQREDLIRADGYRFVRWGWAEVWPRPDAAVGRVARALAARG